MKLQNKLMSALLSVVLLTGSVGATTVLTDVTAVAATATTKLAAPKGIKATKTSDSITLSWNAVNGADSYKVYKYNSSTKKYVKYKSVKTTKCTVTGLKANTTYKFKICAVVDGKNQTSSKAISAKTNPNEKLAAPEDFVASQQTENTITLSWSKVDNAESYRVFQYDSSQKKYVKYKDVKTNKCTISGLNADTTYKFKVCAVVGGKSQTTSKAISAKTNAEEPKLIEWTRSDAVKMYNLAVEAYNKTAKAYSYAKTSYAAVDDYYLTMTRGNVAQARNSVKEICDMMETHKDFELTNNTANEAKTYKEFANIIYETSDRLAKTDIDSLTVKQKSDYAFEVFQLQLDSMWLYSYVDKLIDSL